MSHMEFWLQNIQMCFFLPREMGLPWATCRLLDVLKFLSAPEAIALGLLIAGHAAKALSPGELGSLAEG